MDGGDQDFGSGGIALLDPTVFKGTGVSKIGVTAGKNGKIYILNANNLGGYRLGSGQTDGIIQTIETNKAVFGGSGSYPLEGGYLYSTPVGCKYFLMTHPVRSRFHKGVWDMSWDPELNRLINYLAAYYWPSRKC